MDALLDLSGLVAIVTGAGTGIGARTAHVLAEHGVDVVLAGRKAERLEATAVSVRETTGRSAVVVPTDVRDADAVANLGAIRSWARFGQTPETMGANVPLRRVGYPQDIANGVLYFVSPMSSWVTGQTLLIDGGPAGLGGLSDDDL